jgi:hypothetical protein
VGHGHVQVLLSSVGVGTFSLVSYCHKLPFVSYSILPALSLDGIIDIVVLEGAVDGEVFERFAEGLSLEMLPHPQKNSVLVMDNVRFHHSSGARDILEEA